VYGIGGIGMGGSSEAAFAPGLEGLVAAETRISGVDDGAGVLTLAGFPVEEISGRASFEEMIYVLWLDGLPDAGKFAAFRGRRGLPGVTLDLLRAVAARRTPEMDTLRMRA
jgi:citrate synthase